MILIGSDSMIGSRFVELSKDKTGNLAELNQPEFDLLSSEDEMFAKVSNFGNEVLLCFSAFTNVDGAQLQKGDKQGSCWQLNVEGTKKLVAVCQKLNLKMIYISTDFVFDGKSGPYSETDKTAGSPEDISWYGWTKLEGEKIILSELENFLIVRISYPFRGNFPAKLDFVRNIVKKLSDNSLYPMFSDQYLTPTFIDDLVNALNLLIGNNETGIWHVVNNTTLSAFDAAVEIAQVFGLNEKLVKSTSLVRYLKENPNSVKRSVKGGLKNDKLREFLKGSGFEMKDFRQALLEMKKQMS